MNKSGIVFYMAIFTKIAIVTLLREILLRFSIEYARSRMQVRPGTPPANNTPLILGVYFFQVACFYANVMKQ